MKILIDMINNPQAIVNTDYRYQIFKQIMPIWKNNGHQIYIDKVKNVKIEPSVLKQYNVYNNKEKENIELYICFGVYKEGIERHKYFTQKKVPCITYDHSWLPQSVLFERQKLFSDSFFYNTLEKDINTNYNEEKADEFIKHLLVQNSSKRPQNRKDKIPENIKLKYVFIPFQKSNDISLINYSKIGMFEFAKKIVKICKEKDIPVVMKIHPHVNGQERNKSKNCFNEMKSIYPQCYLINTSIYDLIRNAKFTACLNSGSLIDNFVSQTPVLSCAHSLFDKVECMVFDEDVNKGMERMISGKIDTKTIRENQKKIVYWLKNKLLYSYLSAEENKERFDYLAGITL
jgi:hypothetical protein